MASFNTPDYASKPMNTHIHWLKAQIRDKFQELHNSIKEREKELIEELDLCIHETASYIPANMSHDMSLVNGMPHARRTPLSFEWDYSIFEAISSVGHFTYHSTTPSNHPKDTSSISNELSVENIDENSVVAVGKGGLAPGEFNVPRGLAIDPKTLNIFICDCVNNRVQVFNSDGEHLFHFGSGRGSGRMSNPWSVCISNQNIYVTQFKTGAVQAYAQNGSFLKKAGSKGPGPGQFQYPEGITSDVDGNIIVCDRGNNRVQVLSGDLAYVNEFGGKILKKPRDVKLVADYVIVLDKSNPCLHVFTIRSDKKGVDHIQDMITQGQGGQVCKPTFFTLDGDNCILISDQWNHTIKCFSANGEYRKEYNSSYNLYRPQGIAYNATNHQIVCVCWNQENALQILQMDDI